MLISVIALPVSASTYYYDELDPSRYSHNKFGDPTVSEFVNIINNLSIDGFSLMSPRAKINDIVKSSRFGSTDPRDMIVTLFDGVDKEYIYSANHESLSYVTIFYYDFDDKTDSIEDADVIFYTETYDDFNTSNRYHHELRYAETKGGIEANQNAIEHLKKPLKAFVDKLSTPRKLCEVCEIEYPDLTSFPDDTPESDMGSHIFSSQFPNGLTCMNPDGIYDSEVAADLIRFTDAKTAVLARGIEILHWGASDTCRSYWDPIYKTPLYSGIEGYSLELYYDDTENDTSDPLDATLEKVCFIFKYDRIYDEASTAPQTGISTALLAVVALVSGTYAVKRKMR